MSKGGRRQCPCWLRSDRNYEIIPNAAAAVLWMFRASDNGLSIRQIAENMPKRFRSWASRTRTILTDPRVMGGYLTPYKKGHDSQAGDPRTIPCIVDTVLFARVQEARKNREHGRPRGDFDLYATVAKCEGCGQQMRSRGEGGDRFIVCTNKECPSRGKRWSYPDFDQSFHSVVVEVDRLEVAKGQMLDDKEVFELELTFWNKKKENQEEERKKLNAQIDESDRAIRDLNSDIAAIEASIVEITEDERQDRGQTSERNDRVRLDARHATRIREEVRDVLIAAAGIGDRVEERIEQVKRMEWEPPAALEDVIQNLKSWERTPFFMVRFKNGAALTGVPDKKDPRRVDWSMDESNSEQEQNGLPHLQFVISIDKFPQFSYRWPPKEKGGGGTSSDGS
jgi:hypothetical protein